MYSFALRENSASLMTTQPEDMLAELSAKKSREGPGTQSRGISR